MARAKAPLIECGAIMLAAAMLLATVATAEAAEPVDLYAPISEADRTKARKTIAKLVKNPRGPYGGLAWFCKDGTILPPKLYACVPHGGGLMYGIPGPQADELAELGIHVGTILAAIPSGDPLLDNEAYRARALVIETYLERALDGWALRGAKTYRGFRQIEDEKAAARRLLMELAKRRSMLERDRSLYVRLIRALPYGQVSSQADDIRALASIIGDRDRSFANLRFKIHAMLEPADIDAVERWAARQKGDSQTQGQELAAKMRAFFDPAARLARLEEVKQWVHDDDTKAAIDAALAAFGAVDVARPLDVIRAGHALMEKADSAVSFGTRDRSAERNLLLLHVMTLVEELWLGITAPLAQLPMRRGEALDAAEYLTRAAALLGMLSGRELEAATRALRAAASGEARDYARHIADASRVLEWARARVLADVGVPLVRYESVEPRARGVIDDILRSGVMLPLAALLDRLGRDAEAARGGAHRLLGIASGGVRGENAGIATGPLRIVEAGAELSTLAPSDIALLHDLPPELPPVAGIITVGSAGSLSHVALLARNLGIPHASVGSELAAALAPLAGSEVVLGVSVGRRVLLGALAELPEEERALVTTSAPAELSLEIDAAKLDLSTARPLALAELAPEDKGVRVGPKAAEVARLHALFPERVSDGVALPFGAFVQHVDRPGPRGAPSPLARLKSAWAEAAKIEAAAAEKLMLRELAAFQKAIATLPFADGFEAAVKAALGALGKPESFGVFVRSDTNVEDLKDFTGAGLNKTIPNRALYASIFAAIREVWQSPYSERSYRWRQRLLKNPEQVYPSVLLHRTVPSELSGVLVTTDIEGLWPDAFTVSIAEGVAAVVDGGSPETLVVREQSYRLLASNRSPTRKVVPPPPTEGIVVAAAEGRDPVLGDADIDEVRALVRDVLAKLPPKEGLPWDIELALVGGQAQLLQIRPLKSARAPAVHPLLTALDRAMRVPEAALDPEAPLP